MIFMIEINLLPPQYRTVERTPLPVFLGFVAGVAVVGVMLISLIALRAKADRLTELKTQLTATKDAKAKEVEEIRKIERELADSQGRIDTVLSIAESKVYWAMKLDQLVRILPRYVWLDRIDFDGGKVLLTCKARGTSLQRYTELRQKLRNDTNFMYHFDQIPLTNVDVVAPGEIYLEPKVLSFSLPIPLRPLDGPGARP